MASGVATFCREPRQKGIFLTSACADCRGFAQATKYCVYFGTGTEAQCQPSSSGECHALRTPACQMLQCFRDPTIDSSAGFLFFIGPSSRDDEFPTAPITSLENFQVPVSVEYSEFIGVQVQDLPELDLIQAGLPQASRIRHMYDEDQRQVFMASYAACSCSHLENLKLGALSPGTFPLQVQSLHVINCGINALGLDLMHMHELEELNLSHNQLLELPETESEIIAGLQQVSRLNLSHNELNSFQIHLPELVELYGDLQNNELLKLPGQVFRQEKLKHLYMSNNPLESIVVTQSEFAFLQQLVTFQATFPPTSECSEGQVQELVFAFEKFDLCVVSRASEDSSDSSSSSSTQMKTSSIVLTVATTIAAMISICFVAYYCFRNRLKSFNAGDTDSPGRREETITMTPRDSRRATGMTGFRGNTLVRRTKCLNADEHLHDLRANLHDIERVRILYRGHFGIVWLCQYNGEQVAVKSLLPSRRTTNEVQRFAKEIKIMGRLHHPNIIRFLGAAWSSPLSLCAMAEYEPLGDLQGVLRAPTTKWSWWKPKLQIAIDIAEALAYLHQLRPMVIHRDLKARNILITATHNAKLSVFALSRKRSFEQTMNAGIQSVRYVAPEVILGHPYCEYIDIYSFGVVLSELDTHALPYDDAPSLKGVDLKEASILRQVTKGTIVPTFSDSCPPCILELALHCMQQNPRNRPSARMVVETLQTQVLDELEFLWL